MKKIYLLLSLMILVVITGCVQKTYKRTVVFTLETSKLKDIKKVGIRGKDQPLSWDYDYEMQVVKKDSLYKAIVIYETGYLFTEVKFAINGDFELKEQTNRRINFNTKDTTFYNAKFNVMP